MLLTQWRPISLLTIDYKIISKAMSLRLKKNLPNIIHSNQKCSVEGRSIHEGCHLIRNIIDYVNDRPNMGSAILNRDIKKAFDSISHDYISKVLDAYGFGPQFQQWLKLLYEDIDAKVIVHGHFTQSFPIDRGFRQGCSLSPLLYVLCIEPLANVIRNDPLIKGAFLPGGGQVKLCQYADDITGFLADTFSVRRFLKIVETFGNASGAKLNKDKCNGIWLGRFARDTTIHNYAELKWELNAKIRSIYAGIDDTENANWSTFIARIAKQLDSISQRALTLKGKAVMINTKILSQLWYKATIIDVPKIILEPLHKMINGSIWANKMVLIKRDVLELLFNRGGVNLVNVPIKVKSFQIKHILDLIHGSNSAEWKAFGRYWLGIRLKNIEQVKSKIDWIGPFAETPNEHFKQINGPNRSCRYNHKADLWFASYNANGYT